MVCGGFIVLSETAFKPLPLYLVWSAIDFPLCVCLVCAFASSKRDRFFIIYLPLCPVCKCNRFYFVGLLCVVALEF
ncbi:MAG: hypothetical protein LBC75_01925 [Fibromonadaceae bacterium]|nr:hypothetical protein [Fibromonadaceae bacterium]